MSTEAKIAQYLFGLLGFCFVRGYTSDQQYPVNLDPGSLPGQPILYNYQHEESYRQFPNEINKPIYHAGLGMDPVYHNLVYNYVKHFGGTQPPPHAHAFQPVNFNLQPQYYPPQNQPAVINQSFPPGIANNVGSQSQQTVQASAEEKTTDKPGLNDYFLPSDMLSLPNHPSNRFRGNLDEFKLKKMTSSTKPTSLPPLAGAVSDYVLLRNRLNVQNLLQHSSGTTKENEPHLQQIKRETSDDEDSVVIHAETFQSQKDGEDVAEHRENDKEDDGEKEVEEDQPSIAQSKPSAIALAGPGGVAQASPVGTALVGQGGLAVSAPSGTAIAGRRGGGSIPIPIAADKKKSNEKNEDFDSD